MKQCLAPIVLFVYNRLWHTQQTVEALQKNELAADSDLFIFSDGAKNTEDQYKVDEVRQYLKTITGFKSVSIEESTINKGLANSIIYGVTKIVNQFGKVIVLEDDLVTSKYLLKYLNQYLEHYAEVDEVISIHGFTYPIGNLPEVYFIKGADCLAWATWKRGWDLFESDGQKLLALLTEKNLVKEFEFNNSYPYMQMLRDQIAGKNSSWAIRWYASAFLANKLTLYPGKTLVKHIGFDNSGTNCGNNDPYKSEIIEQDFSVLEIPIIECSHARNEFIKFFNKLNKTSYRKKIARKILYIIKGIK